MRDKSKLTVKQAEILAFLKESITNNGYPPSIREICQAVNLKSTSSVHAYLEALENKGYIEKNSHNSRSIRILEMPAQEASDEAAPAGVSDSSDKSTISGSSDSYAISGSSDSYVVSDSSTVSGSSPVSGTAKSEAAAVSSSEAELPAGELVMVPVIGTVAAGVPILAAEQIETWFPVPADRLPNRQTFFLRVKGDSMVNAGILDRDLVLVEQKNTAENGDIVVALIEDSATVKTFYREEDHIRLQPQNDYMDPIIVRDNLTILGKVIGDMRFF